MDDMRLSEGIANNSSVALAYAKRLLTNGDKVSQGEFASMWKGTIEAEINGNMDAARKMASLLDKFGLYGEAQMMYYRMYILLSHNPGNEHLFKVVISTAAEVARLNSGRVPAGMDREWYIKTAGSTFIKLLERGDNICRKYTAEVADNIDSKEMLTALSEVVQNDKDPEVRKAADGACERIRIRRELETAEDDRRYLLGIYDSTLPEALFIDMTYDAIETVLKLTRGSIEGTLLRSSVHQLASFAKNHKQLESLFNTASDTGNLDTIRWSVENALFHALNTGSLSLKKEAGVGLVRIGSDRVQEVLSKIVLRAEDGSDTSNTAIAAHAEISSVKFGSHVLPPLRPAHGTPAQPASALRLVSRQ